MKRKAKNYVIYFYYNLIQHVSMSCNIGNKKKAQQNMKGNGRGKKKPHTNNVLLAITFGIY